jgi:hypothetical protein
MHFLISGIPASGKTTFCKWLEEKKGFLHLDVEKPGVLDRYGLVATWNTLFGVGASATPFIEALDKFKRPVAIDWGFPPECLHTVRKLFEAGVMLWWFAADWAVARRKFIVRGGKGPVAVFDNQLRKIEAALSEINALFGSHKEYTLPSTGIYPPPEKIWKSTLDTLVEPSRRRLGAPIPRLLPDPSDTPINKPHSHATFRPNSHAEFETYTSGRIRDPTPQNP